MFCLFEFLKTLLLGKKQSTSINCSQFFGLTQKLIFLICDAALILAQTKNFERIFLNPNLEENFAMSIFFAIRCCIESLIIN